MIEERLSLNWEQTVFEDFSCEFDNSWRREFFEVASRPSSSGWRTFLFLWTKPSQE